MDDSTFMDDVPPPRTRREARRWVRLYWSRWLRLQDYVFGNDAVYDVFDDETRKIADRLAPPEKA